MSDEFSAIVYMNMLTDRKQIVKERSANLVLTASENLSKKYSIVTIISAFRDKNDDAEVKQLSGLLNA